MDAIDNEFLERPAQTCGPRALTIEDIDQQNSMRVVAGLMIALVAAILFALIVPMVSALTN